MGCTVVDAVDEREGVEGKVDEGKPEERPYLCPDPLSLDSGFLVIEAGPAVHVSLDLHCHRDSHTAGDQQEEVERDVPQHKLQDLTETIPSTVHSEGSNPAPAARGAVRLVYEWQPTPEEREGVCPHPEGSLRGAGRYSWSPQQPSHEQIVDYAHECEHLHPGRVLVDESSEIAVGIQQGQLGVEVDSCDGVREGVEEGSDGEMEDQPLRKVAVPPLDSYGDQHGETAGRREGAHGSSNCSNCYIWSCVVGLQTIAAGCRAGATTAAQCLHLSDRFCGNQRARYSGRG